MEKKLTNQLTKTLSILGMFFLIISCSSDLDITEFTKKDISKDFNYTDDGVLYYKKTPFSGKIKKYNYVGGDLILELNLQEGNYEGTQSVFRKDGGFEHHTFIDGLLDSYIDSSAYSGFYKYYDQRGNVLELSSKKDTISYLKIEQDGRISFPIVYGEINYNKKNSVRSYTVKESKQKDSLILYNDHESIVYKNLNSIHQIYPKPLNKISDISTPWSYLGYGNDISYLGVSKEGFEKNKKTNEKPLFTNLYGENNNLNVFEQKETFGDQGISPYTTNMEIISKRSYRSGGSNDLGYYNEWEDYIFKDITGDSLKGRQLKLSIVYNEVGLDGFVSKDDINSHKLRDSNFFIYSDSIKSKYYENYLVYPKDITIRKGDTIQSFSYDFREMWTRGSLKRPNSIYLDGLSQSHIIRFNLDDLNDYENYTSFPFKSLSFRFDDSFNNRVLDKSYHYISSFTKHKDFSETKSIIMNKISQGDVNPNLEYYDTFLFKSSLTDSWKNGVKIVNINNFNLTKISWFNNEKGQQGAGSYGDERRRYYNGIKELNIVNEIDVVVKYVNELSIILPNTGLEFIKNNL